MCKKIGIQTLAFACIMAACSLQPVFAQTAVTAGTIKQIDTGWSSDTFGLMTTAPIINPAGCSAADMYESSQPAAGYSTYYAAALTAFSTGAQVSVVVSNTTCTQNRPTIIGLYIVAP
jgi:ABC-type proline/glycine betaine transport system substrate-binding protein